MDENGYPDGKELEKIRQWGYESGYKALMDYIHSLWCYPDCFEEKPGGWYEVHTMGWSGNESLIGAMESNQVFWAICWQQSNRGGHYKFHIKEVK